MIAYKKALDPVAFNLWRCPATVKWWTNFEHSFWSLFSLWWKWLMLKLVPVSSSASSQAVMQMHPKGTPNRQSLIMTGSIIIIENHLSKVFPIYWAILYINSLQIYFFSFNWMLVNKKWVDLQAMSAQYRWNKSCAVVQAPVRIFLIIFHCLESHRVRFLHIWHNGTFY